MKPLTSIMYPGMLYIDEDDDYDDITDPATLKHLPTAYAQLVYVSNQTKSIVIRYKTLLSLLVFSQILNWKFYFLVCGLPKNENNYITYQIHCEEHFCEDIEVIR